MQDFKISLITVTFNAGSTISRCIESVIGQNFTNIEYIVIDGGSTDNTLEILDQYKAHINILVSESDKGIYDAMDKGIKLANGDVIGMLNADDFFADSIVLNTIADTFVKQEAQIVYGDLDYINLQGKIVRKWRSGVYTRNKFKYGWMPPHPTFYCKKDLFKQFGLYSLEHGTAADYELMLRFMYLYKVKAVYLPKVLVKMSTGGASNKTLNSRIKGLFFDLKAMRNNRIPIPAVTLILKPLRKIIQYFN